MENSLDILKDLNVLYVEDNNDISEKLSKILKRIVANLLHAKTAEQGLHMFENGKDYFDIVITDINLPKMNGLDMIKEIKKMANPQVIIITAYSDKNVFIDAINSGVDKYILKPINLKQLYKALMDCNSIVELKKRVRKQNQMLLSQSRQAAMGEMISMIAHQWRQPISTVSMLVSNILLEIELGDLSEDRAKNSLNQINEQIQYLSSTISDFKNFFKPNQSKAQVKLSEIMSDTLKIIRKSIENSNIVIEESYLNDFEFKTYKNQVVQVLLVILKNAQDVLLDNSIEKPRIFITSGSLENNKIYISIEDNAGGIKLENPDVIFEPYFSTKNEKNGTGLGLYMCKMIVERHLNGEIFVENIENGAKFVIEIPL
jgi:signal transduction histidine kinase